MVCEFLISLLKTSQDLMARRTCFSHIATTISLHHLSCSAPQAGDQASSSHLSSARLLKDELRSPGICNLMSDLFSRMLVSLTGCFASWIRLSASGSEDMLAGLTGPGELMAIDCARMRALEHCAAMQHRRVVRGADAPPSDRLRSPLQAHVLPGSISGEMQPLPGLVREAAKRGVSLSLALGLLVRKYHESDAEQHPAESEDGNHSALRFSHWWVALSAISSDWGLLHQVLLLSHARQASVGDVTKRVLCGEVRGEIMQWSFRERFCFSPHCPEPLLQGGSGASCWGQRSSCGGAWFCSRRCRDQALGSDGGHAKACELLAHASLGDAADCTDGTTTSDDDTVGGRSKEEGGIMDEYDSDHENYGGRLYGEDGEDVSYGEGGWSTPPGSLGQERGYEPVLYDAELVGSGDDDSLHLDVLGGLD